MEQICQGNGARREEYSRVVENLQKYWLREKITQNEASQLHECQSTATAAWPPIDVKQQNDVGNPILYGYGLEMYYKGKRILEYKYAVFMQNLQWNMLQFIEIASRHKEKYIKARFIFLHNLWCGAWQYVIVWTFYKYRYRRIKKCFPKVLCGICRTLLCDISEERISTISRNLRAGQKGHLSVLTLPRTIVDISR